MAGLRKVQEQPGGFEFSPVRGWYSLIVPKPTTNLVKNPSFELGIAGWTFTNAIGSQQSGTALAGSTTRGRYSLRVWPQDPSIPSYTEYSATTTAGVTYSCAADVIAIGAAKGEKYSFEVYDGATLLASQSFTGGATSLIDRPELTFKALSSTSTLRVSKTSGSFNYWYIDAVQLEADSYCTTYIDGDMEGGIWTGRPHASTSYRPYGVAGGRKLNLKRDAKLRVFSYSGFGLPEVENITENFAILNGAQIQATTVKPRTFSIEAALTCRNLNELHSARQTLVSGCAPDAGSKTPKYLILCYQRVDPQTDEPVGREIWTPCIYAGGLTGQIENNLQEKISLKLLELKPPSSYETTENVAAMSYQAALTTEYTALKDMTTGALTALYRPITFSTQRAPQFYFDKEQDLWQMTWVSITDPAGTTTTLTTGTFSDIPPFMATASSVDGRKVYFGGYFTAPKNKMMVYDKATATYTQVGSGWNANDFVRAICFDNSGRMWVGGNIAGPFAKLAYSTNGGTSWTAISVNGTVTSLSMGPDGKLYAAGGFSTIGGVSTGGVARYNFKTSTWESVDFTGIIVSDAYSTGDIAAFSDGSILLASSSLGDAGGPFTTDAAFFDGATWNMVDIGNLTSTPNHMFVAKIPSGRDGNTFKSLSGQYVINGATGFHLYGGKGQLRLATIAKSDNLCRAVAISSNGMQMALSADGTLRLDAVTSIDYAGTAPEYPSFVINGPGTLRHIRNYTTGKSLFFEYVMLDGEQLKLTLQPDNITFNSNLRGNVFPEIRAGSDYSSFILKPKTTNNIGVFISDATGANTSVLMYYHNRHWSLDAVGSAV